MPRSTRRQGRREADPEDGDGDDADGDDFAWQSPKKKGKKSTGRTERASSGKKSTGSAKSARSKSADGGSSTRSSKGSAAKSTKKKASSGGGSSGPSSSTRKSGSARRKSASDEEDLNNSGRRRRVPAKKKGVDPIVPISIVSATILICIGLFFFLKKPPRVVVDQNRDWDSAKKIEEDGMAAYREFLKARDSDQPDLIKAKREEAILKLRSAVEAMNAILDPKRDAEGMLPSDLEGYERDLSQITKYLIDLEKM